MDLRSRACPFLLPSFHSFISDDFPLPVQTPALSSALLLFQRNMQLRIDFNVLSLDPLTFLWFSWPLETLPLSPCAPSTFSILPATNQTFSHCGPQTHPSPLPRSSQAVYRMADPFCNRFLSSFSISTSLPSSLPLIRSSSLWNTSNKIWRLTFSFPFSLFYVFD